MKDELFCDIVSFNENLRGRIGGNIPTALLATIDAEYDFYGIFQIPDKKDMFFSIFTPKDFEVMLENNIYPNCSIKVIIHKYSEESKELKYTNNNLNKFSLTNYETLEKDYFTSREINNVEFNKNPDGFVELYEPHHNIVIGRKPILIQEDAFYYQKLLSDGYSFFMQIDEKNLPDGFIKKDYVFGYGSLYLYAKYNGNSEIVNITAGFWQN